ncbi:helix-turn-helix domain-containing protein [bacterium]|nr:helix-turn-helix domain-containing protein [bacterium]
MANIGKMLKEEIQRLARKVVKAALAGLHRDSVALKRSVADYRKRIAALERSTRQTLKVVEPQLEAARTPAPEEADRARITGAMVRRIRGKLGLSQADFARLVGVTAQTVYQWEQKPGRLQFRGNAKSAVLAARRMGVREARRRVEELKGTPAPGTGNGRRRRAAGPAPAAKRGPGRPRAEAASDAPITGKTVRRLRGQLGLSQADLARLLDLHTQTVYQWEHKPGPLQFRGDARARLAAVQRMGAGEVKKRLESLQAKSTRKRGRRGGRKRRKA